MGFQVSILEFCIRLLEQVFKELGMAWIPVIALLLSILSVFVLLFIHRRKGLSAGSLFPVKLLVPLFLADLVFPLPCYYLLFIYRYGFSGNRFYMILHLLLLVHTLLFPALYFARTSIRLYRKQNPDSVPLMTFVLQSCSALFGLGTIIETASRTVDAEMGWMYFYLFPRIVFLVGGVVILFVFMAVMKRNRQNQV